jgi:transposase
VAFPHQAEPLGLCPPGRRDRDQRRVRLHRWPACTAAAQAAHPRPQQEPQPCAEKHFQEHLHAVDLAKNVFEIAVSNRACTIKEGKRLLRPQFEQFWGTRKPCRVVMDACSTSHFWGRHLLGLGFEVILLPPHYVRPYRRRNKTDRSDCEALLEAARCGGTHPVAVKTQVQQTLMALHRVRSQWLRTRTARINTMRGLLREFGVTVPLGSKLFMNGLHPAPSETAGIACHCAYVRRSSPSG